ncbi:hypothetical protein C9374_013523 [Naegleria lovaniensis]|uniref:Protein kinase domain-containing protein n=1 Tax=Naegleria lovaniensis TaxID=51637 RepID=A0AA88GZH3_NAELO|nr:uncharacterized protein C9374_013523 [Naegleria lovaniensis]KAG2392038.1 hypothetical protein C9374_013523 [Naegleria lovaniensis]
MCAFYIIKKFKLLQEKERAEKNIEKKIIDKRIIFGMDEEMHDHTENSSLHKPLLGTTSSDHHHHSPSRHQQKQKPSFIIPIEHIEIEKKVAAGGFGVVYKGKLWNKVDVAIKLLKASDREEMDEEFEKEVSLVSSLRHANIVTFYGICLTSDSKYMVTEFLSKGSLDKIISKSKQGLEPLSLVTKLFILIGTAKGMEYLHGMTPRVIHRDLKPGNILLDSHFEAKICDFGISRTVANTTTAMQSAFTMNLGTLFYMAPELLDPQSEQFMSNMSKQERVDYYTKLDVYSFGIILHEVFFEETPFVSNASKLSPLNSVGTSSSDYSNHCFNIPQLVLQGKRPTIPFSTEEQVLTWIQEYMPLSERKSLRNLPQSILMYFSVVERAWSSQPLSRPTFTEIRKSLEEIYLLIQQDTEL